MTPELLKQYLDSGISGTGFKYKDFIGAVDMGLPDTEIARIIGVDRRTVKKWRTIVQARNAHK